MLDHKDIVEEIKVIVFRLKDEEYGVEVNQVKSIERLEHITRVPRTSYFVKGVINMRGIVTPIVDLRRRFGLEEAVYNETTRVIIVAVGEIEVGLIVDSANDVIDIPINAIEPPPEVVGGIEAVYLRGVAKLDRRLLILLNLDKVLNTDEIKQLENLEA
ncbi:purine-binding chemotaxis protein CheW [Aneurinibacillus soli]|uniref:Chemotaxis protein CheW n=1 Tax=Aneurinibacillus soli TaxID=1500254 RepID=A0A0U5B9T5_9BACL|nr:chemotaxis protein CheW [Aneurinibacillus soli]PYE63377.1 purine-binding chemotaxis protein CheW [Aneurinibacillus soli]BAU27692.1 Chemotaxis protein CheW [Aneurinibacillus soli]